MKSAIVAITIIAVAFAAPLIYKPVPTFPDLEAVYIKDIKPTPFVPETPLEKSLPYNPYPYILPNLESTQPIRYPSIIKELIKPTTTVPVPELEAIKLPPYITPFYPELEAPRPPPFIPISPNLESPKLPPYIVPTLPNLESPKLPPYIVPTLPNLESPKLPPYIVPTLPNLESPKLPPYIVPTLPNLEASRIPPFITPTFPELEASKLPPFITPTFPELEASKLPPFITPTFPELEAKLPPFITPTFPTIRDTPLLEGSCSCDSIQNMVAQAEGKRTCVYKDTLGHPTIGIGFNLDRSDAKSLISKLGLNYEEVRSGKKCLSDKQITTLFDNDLSWAKAGAAKYISNWSKQPKCVQNVLIDMTFNMGKAALGGWPNFCKQIENKQYNEAAANMKSSKWCGQVGNRCTRNVGIVKSC